LLQLGEVLACFAAVAFSAYGANSGAGDAVHVESELMWYTTMALDDSTVLVGKFKERFPRINVKLFRANDAQLLNRLLTENRAKTTIADVVSASGLPIGILKDRGLLTKYRSAEAAAFPDGAKDPNGYWTDTYVNTFNLVYNTTMVSAKDVPKSYEGLLDPRWKQKMAFDDSDYEWFW
jgi:iron(III) transport system substrate-binding protein